jgi:hypothetical protein
VSELSEGYRTVRVSDVKRDGMYLELIEEITGDEIGEVFYSDESNSMTVSLFKPALPIGVVELFIRRAKDDLPPRKTDD